MLSHPVAAKNQAVVKLGWGSTRPWVAHVPVASSSPSRPPVAPRGEAKLTQHGGVLKARSPPESSQGSLHSAKGKQNHRWRWEETHRNTWGARHYSSLRHRHLRDGRSMAKQRAQGQRDSWAIKESPLGGFKGECGREILQKLQKLTSLGIFRHFSIQ